MGTYLKLIDPEQQKWKMPIKKKQSQFLESIEERKRVENIDRFLKTKKCFQSMLEL